MDDTAEKDKLLPVNASQLEVDLDSLFDADGAISHAANKVRTAKLVDIPESFIPWLVYEYGLEDIMPWLDDRRLALREGVRWQKIKGTPASLLIALGWGGFQPKAVEQEVTGRHFYQFQLETGDSPYRVTELRTTIEALARLSAPLRSRLSRVFNEHNDIRRFIISESPWGDLLSNYSGVVVTEAEKDNIIYSFGNKNGIPVNAPSPELPTGCERSNSDISYYPRGLRLSGGVLGDVMQISWGTRATHWSAHITQLIAFFVEDKSKGFTLNRYTYLHLPYIPPKGTRMYTLRDLKIDLQLWVNVAQSNGFAGSERTRSVKAVNKRLWEFKRDQKTLRNLWLNYRAGGLRALHFKQRYHKPTVMTYEGMKGIRDGLTTTTPIVVYHRMRWLHTPVPAGETWTTAKPRMGVNNVSIN